MKKIFIYMVWAAVAFATVSCVSPLDNPVSVRGDQTVLRLTPVVAGISTKADPTEAGDNTYNENTITDYYWYIFSDAAGTTCVLSGHETSDASKEILLDDKFPSGGTGYVYVVANLPEAPAATTYAGLQNVSFGTSMPTTYTNSSEFYEYTSATTGVPKPKNFVMRTEKLVPFTLEEKTVVPVEAPLKRVAAKIILDLNVAKEVEQTQTLATGVEKYVKTWLSDIEHIQVYMLWGSTHGNLKGDHFHYGDTGVESAWFYSASPRYAMYTDPVGGKFNGTGIDGKVPSDRYTSTNLSVATSVWEVVYQVKDENNDGEPDWIWNSGVAEADKIDANIGNKAYGDWDYVLVNGEKQPVLNADGTVQRQLATRTETKPYWQISSLPLYSMPISWNVNDAHAPFIKVILPWKGYDKDTQTPAQAVAKEFYYKILIPNRTTLDANGCYHISLDLSVLGSEADEVPVALTGKYHVVDWNDPEPMGGDQTAGRYLDCATYFEFYSTDATGAMDIPVKSSHDIQVVLTGAYKPTATYDNYSAETATTGTLNRHTSTKTGAYYTLSTTGNSKVTVSHVVETNLDDMESYDVSPITYTFRIEHKDNAAYCKDITVVQYPSLFIKAELNSNYSLGTTQYDRDRYKGYVYVNNQQNNNSDRWYYTGGLYGASGNQNPNMYVITTTVLNSDLNYVLGDPRVDVINNLNYDFASAPSIGGGNRSLSYYYPTDGDNSKRHFISPSYRIVSSYGRFGGDKNLALAQRRCAAYQEDGYPAGRWRLPTEAELEYITTLSSKGLIPKLFNIGGTYWSAQSAVTVNNDGTVSISSATTAFARCVYDEWYWSEKDAQGNETNIVNKQTFTWGDKQR